MVNNIIRLLAQHEIIQVLNSDEMAAYLTDKEVEMLLNIVNFHRFDSVKVNKKSGFESYMFLDDNSLTGQLMVNIKGITVNGVVGIRGSAMLQLRGLMLYYAQVNNLPQVCLLMIVLELFGADQSDMFDGKVFLDRQQRGGGLFGYLNPLSDNADIDENTFIITCSIYAQVYEKLLNNRR
ncbi:hypothetical protein EQG49_06620 [Periweissella cryptocerci]|uniref:Uncharacterized protein n=1 Tax=Periweissella cryptocerci TaxID=2506420 RepID=A0A4V1AIN8_9LACO|nr:hypothetical protein [Periweissella cryptocerci]QBO36155.1 hypothetical protein EQG49_06620 [Periweissella cryptocerci]